MAYVPTNPGWGAAATVAKIKPPKKVGAFDPYNATTDDLVKYLFNQQSQGPDYSQIPAGPTDQQLQDAASQRASALLTPYQTAYNAQSDTLDRKRANSQQAATAFAEAMASILQGGKTGAEGMQYAHDNYGGSYLGAVAADMGKQLFAQITHDFDQQDFKIANDLAEVMAKQPEIENDIYNQLAKAENDRIASGMKIADTAYETRIKALAGYVSTKIKMEKDQRDALAKAIGSGASAEPRIFQSGGTIVALDPVTGKTIWQHQAPQDPADPTKPTTKMVNGVLVQWDPATNTWGPAQGNLPPAKPTGTSDNKSRAKLFYDTRSDVFAAARSLMQNGSIDGSKPSSSDALPGGGPTDGTAITWNTAYNMLWGEWGIALVGQKFSKSRVRQMIVNALKTAGFKKDYAVPRP